MKFLRGITILTLMITILGLYHTVHWPDIWAMLHHYGGL